MSEWEDGRRSRLAERGVPTDECRQYFLSQSDKERGSLPFLHTAVIGVIKNTTVNPLFGFRGIEIPIPRNWIFDSADLFSQLREGKREHLRRRDGADEEWEKSPHLPIYEFSHCPKD